MLGRVAYVRMAYIQNNLCPVQKHLQLTVDRLGKTSFIETSLFSSCVYPAYSVCIARGTQNAQDTHWRQPESVANDQPCQLESVVRHKSDSLNQRITPSSFFIVFHRSFIA